MTAPVGPITIDSPDPLEPQSLLFRSMVATTVIEPGVYSHGDFDFTKSRVKLFGTHQTLPGNAYDELEYYDYPGGFENSNAGDALALIRLQERQVRLEEFVAWSNARKLFVGGKFTLTGHPIDSMNRDYLLTAATYRLHGHDAETSNSTSNAFDCLLSAIDAKRQFRTAATTRKPVVHGPQTAIVVGPKGYEIWTDLYGRVKVRFHWDRRPDDGPDESKNVKPEDRSCYVRVSQVWAGTGFGGLHTPRIGQEVIIDFLEGDPDRPIITGRVYNDANMPPYEIPKHPTRSGIKSRSTLGGYLTNANEIRFEDLKGQEELYIQAERNETTLVKANQGVSVGADRSLSVGGNETISVTGTRTTTVTKKDKVTLKDEHEITVAKKVTQAYQDDQQLTVTGNQTIEVDKDLTEHVKQKYELTTDTEFKLTQGNTVLTFQSNQVSLDAASSITVTRGPAKLTIDDSGQVTLNTPTGITFQVGPNTIAMSPSGIEIKGPQISLKADPSALELGPASAKLTGATTTVEGTATCSVKGTAMLNLNSG